MGVQDQTLLHELADRAFRLQKELVAAQQREAALVVRLGVGAVAVSEDMTASDDTTDGDFRALRTAYKLKCHEVDSLNSRLQTQEHEVCRLQQVQEATAQENQRLAEHGKMQMGKLASVVEQAVKLSQEAGGFQTELVAANAQIRKLGLMMTGSKQFHGRVWPHAERAAKCVKVDIKSTDPNAPRPPGTQQEEVKRLRELVLKFSKSLAAARLELAVASEEGTSCRTEAQALRQRVAELEELCTVLRASSSVDGSVSGSEPDSGESTDYKQLYHSKCSAFDCLAYNMVVASAQLRTLETANTQLRAEGARGAAANSALIRQNAALAGERGAQKLMLTQFYGVVEKTKAVQAEVQADIERVAMAEATGCLSDHSRQLGVLQGRVKKLTGELAASDAALASAVRDRDEFRRRCEERGITRATGGVFEAPVGAFEHDH